MVNLDKNQDSSYSWLNILIILITIMTVVYIVYAFINPKPDYSEDLIKDIPQANVITIEESKPTILSNHKPSENVIFSENIIDKTITEADITADTDTTTPFLLIDKNEEIEDNYTDLLEASDQRIFSSLAEFSQQTANISALLHDDMLRNTVVFVENFSRGYFVSKFSPMTAPDEKFIVQHKEGKLIIDPRSYQRYDRYADYLDSIDSKAFVQYYQSLKPTIDDFYAEIAKPNATFDTALTKAISVVLTTPVIYDQEIEVNSPSVMYLYNNPELEVLNNAQKLLLRMGPDNLSKIKNKLRGIQAELAISNK